MFWPPKRYRQPAWLAAVVVAGWAESALAQSLHDAGLAPEVALRPDGSASAEAGSPTAPLDAGRGSPQPTVAPSEEAPAFLHATVNQVDIGDVYVILRGNDVIVKVTDLENSGMRVEGGKREKAGEDLLVSLQSLAPKLSFVFDERSLSLTITADSKLFGGSVLDLRAKRPEGIIYDNAPSMFVNYRVGLTDLQSVFLRQPAPCAAGTVATGASQTRDQAGWNGFAESGLSVRGHLLYASGQRSEVDGSWERLLTNLTLDLRDRLTSIVIGDVNATSDALGGGGMMGGVSVARNFGLDPYYIFLPTQQLAGTALTPSTVEIYVNGQLVRREVLPPGQFSVQNLPVTSGSGQTQVVIRDAFGNSQTMASPYYLALGTLAKGLQDFSYNVGFMRQNYGTESWDYGQPALLFRHRLGVTNWLTIGARVEGALHFDRSTVGSCTERIPHMLSGGPSLAIRLPVGEVGASAALSGQGRFVGGAALLSYSYIGRLLNFQVGARFQSNDYANLYLTPASLPPPNALPTNIPSASDRQRKDLLASIAKNIDKVANLSLQDEATEWLNQGWTNRITLAANRSITRWMYAFVTVSNTYSHKWPVEYDTFAGLSFAPADRVTAGATRTDRWGGQSGYGGTSQATVQQSLPLGPGLGYRVVMSQGENALNEGTAQYQGAYGRIEADYQHLGYGDDRGHASLTATGGLILIGGSAYLTRPVQDSYALIRVPGVAGVHGTMSNQVMGTTDSKGNLLIPSLLHYYGNRVGIDDKDIPLDHDIGATERVIAPPYRGGAVVAFPVRRVQSVSGTVVIDDQGATVLPTYGQLVVLVDKQQVVSPLDEAGNFYLENVPPGSFSAEVQYAAGVCKLPLAVPAGATALVNVGTIRCILPKKEAR